MPTTPRLISRGPIEARRSEAAGRRNAGSTPRLISRGPVVPTRYSAWLQAYGIHDAGGRDLPAWSVGEALRVMDEHAIARAILSVSAPGVHLNPGLIVDPEARAMARDVNEFAARLASDDPDRFGFLATVTLPDVDGAIAEAAHALDTLRADGVILLATTHGHYLGGAEDVPLLAELDRRRAVVFIHPSALPGPQVEGIPAFAADFLLDTTRAACRLVRSGAVGRYRRLEIVLAHAGGFLPHASHRIATALLLEMQRSPLEVLDDLGSSYFDTALSGSWVALPGLLAFARSGHVVFGSD